MVDQATNEENKATTPAQGAGGSAEKVEQPNAEQLIAELLRSNAEVIVSNQLVIDAISEFKETAGVVFAEAVRSVAINTGYSATKVEVETVEIDPKAKYVVAKDMSFRDSNDFNKVYKSGDDVSNFEEARLINLVQIGHVMKKSK